MKVKAPQPMRNELTNPLPLAGKLSRGGLVGGRAGGCLVDLLYPFLNRSNFYAPLGVLSPPLCPMACGLISKLEEVRYSRRDKLLNNSSQQS